jgi:hypothetical protein
MVISALCALRSGQGTKEEGTLNGDETLNRETKEFIMNKQQTPMPFFYAGRTE